jgi:hypothetical protein
MQQPPRLRTGGLRRFGHADAAGHQRRQQLPVLARWSGPLRQPFAHARPTQGIAETKGIGDIAGLHSKRSGSAPSREAIKEKGSSGNRGVIFSIQSGCSMQARHKRLDHGEHGEEQEMTKREGDFAGCAIVLRWPASCPFGSRSSPCSPCSPWFKLSLSSRTNPRLRPRESRETREKKVDR